MRTSALFAAATAAVSAIAAAIAGIALIVLVRAPAAIGVRVRSAAIAAGGILTPAHFLRRIDPVEHRGKPKRRRNRQQGHNDNPNAHGVLIPQTA